MGASASAQLSAGLALATTGEAVAQAYAAFFQSARAGLATALTGTNSADAALAADVLVLVSLFLTHPAPALPRPRLVPKAGAFALVRHEVYQLRKPSDTKSGCTV